MASKRQYLDCWLALTGRLKILSELLVKSYVSSVHEKIEVSLIPPDSSWEVVLRKKSNLKMKLTLKMNCTPVSYL